MSNLTHLLFIKHFIIGACMQFYHEKVEATNFFTRIFKAIHCLRINFISRIAYGMVE